MEPLKNNTEPTPKNSNGEMNFSNCNLTIINNNHFYNIYQGQQPEKDP